MNISIVGTSHISEESADEVNEIIKKEQPDIVCVELDFLRYNSIRDGEVNNETSLIDVLKERNAQVVFEYISSNFGDKLGVTPGTDMKTAIDTAEEEGIPVAFIDRDIRVTMSRLNSKMTLKEKIYQFLSLFLIPFINKDDVEKYSENEDEIRETLKSKFPSFHEVLIEERDDYMSEKISGIMNEYDSSVVVVGRLHKKGIEQKLDVS